MFRGTDVMRRMDRDEAEALHAQLSTELAALEAEVVLHEYGTPQERGLRARFGELRRRIMDASMRVPRSTQGCCDTVTLLQLVKIDARRAPCDCQGLVTRFHALRDRAVGWHERTDPRQARANVDAARRDAHAARTRAAQLIADGLGECACDAAALMDCVEAGAKARGAAARVLMHDVPDADALLKEADELIDLVVCSARTADCSICHEPLSYKQALVRLPCGHMMHIGCAWKLDPVRSQADGTKVYMCPFRCTQLFARGPFTHMAVAVPGV